MIAQLHCTLPEDPSGTLPAGSAEFVMGFGFTGIAGLLTGQNSPQLGAAGPAIPTNVPKNYREHAPGCAPHAPSEDGTAITARNVKASLLIA
jgi:hypothetical protein